MSTAAFPSRRHLAEELMDDPALERAELRGALRALSRVHRLSGTGVRLRRVLDEVWKAASRRPLRIIDVACGGGDAALDAARWARRAGAELEVVAFDRSPEALQVVRERARRRGLTLTCVEGDARHGLPDGPFDVAFSSLFLHHLDDGGVVSVLEGCVSAARRVFVEDLRRTRTGLLLAHLTLRLVSRSRVAWHDGPASVRAGWRRGELATLVRRSGISGARIARVWPQRLVVDVEVGARGGDVRGRGGPS